MMEGRWSEGGRENRSERESMVGRRVKEKDGWTDRWIGVGGTEGG